jgi:transposase
VPPAAPPSGIHSTVSAAAGDKGTADGERRRSWECSDCRVTSRRMDGEAAPLPEGWVRDGSATRCLACERERFRAADDDEATEARLALVEDELRRDRGDAREIARRTGASPHLVRMTRVQMRNAGELPKPARPAKAPNKPSPQVERRERVEAELRRDPERSDSEIGRAVEVTPKTVGRVRKALGIAPHRPRETRRREDAATLRRLGAATAQKFAEEVGAGINGARARLEALTASGAATRRRGRRTTGAAPWIYEAAEPAGTTPASA